MEQAAGAIIRSHINVLKNHPNQKQE